MMTSKCWRVLPVVVVVIAMAGVPAGAQQEEPVVAEPAPAAQEAPAAAPETPAEPAVAEPPQAPAATEFGATVDFKLDGPVALDAKVGEVELRSVEFVRAPVKSGMIKGAFGSGNEDLKSEITVRLSCATSAAAKWKLDVMVEFLDAEGTVIDRASSSGSLKSEAKIIDFKLGTLSWVVPHIASAKLAVSAKQ